jgi:hypothetical protein
MVSIPGGNPMGQVFNGGANFQVVRNLPSRFIFATEAGIISGWNPGVNQTDVIAEFDNSAWREIQGLGHSNPTTGTRSLIQHLPRSRY